MKVAELKKILDANKITYPKKAKKEDLIQLVKNIIQELNPEKKPVKKVEVIQPYVAPQKDTSNLVSFADRESKKYTEPLPAQSLWESMTDRQGNRIVGLVDDDPTLLQARRRRERLEQEQRDEVQRGIRQGLTAQQAEEARQSRELALATHPVEASLKGISGFLSEEEAIRRLEAGIEAPRVKFGTMTPASIQSRGQDLEDKVLLQQVLVEKKPIPALPPRTKIPKQRVAFGKTNIPTEPLKPPSPPPSPRRLVVEDVSQKKRPAPSIRKASESRPEPQRVTEDDVLRSGLLEAVGAREPSVSRASVRRGSYGRSASHDTQQEKLKEIVRQEEVRQESIRRSSLTKPDPIVFNDEPIGEFKSDDEPSAPPVVTPDVVSNILEALKLADAYQVPPPLSRGSSRESSRGRSTPRPSPPPSPRTQPYTNPIVELLPPVSMARSATPSPKPPPSPKPKTLAQIEAEQIAEHAKILQAQESKADEALRLFMEQQAREQSETPAREPTPARVTDYDRILKATLLAQTLPSESQDRPSESVEQFNRQEKAQIELADKALAEYEALRLQSPARSQSRGSRSRGRFASTREESLAPLREGTEEEESDIPEEQFKFIKEQEKVAPKEAPKRQSSVPRPKTRKPTLKDLETAESLDALNEELNRTSAILRRSQDSVNARRSLSQDLISKPATEVALQELQKEGAKARIEEQKEIVKKVTSKPIPKTKKGRDELLKQVEEAKQEIKEIQEEGLVRPRPKPKGSKFSAPKTEEILKSEIQSLFNLGVQPPKEEEKPKPKTKTTSFAYEIPKEVVTDKPETKAVKIKSIPRPTKLKPSERRLEEDDDSAYVLPEYSQPLVTKDPKKLKLARKIQDKLIEDAKLKAQALFKAKEEAERAKLDAKERKIKEAQAEAEEKEKEQRELKKIRKEAEEEEKKKLEARRKLEAKAEEKRQKIRDAEVARVKALEKAKEEIARQKEAVKERRLEPRGASEEPRGATPSRLAERLERSKTPTRSSSQSRPSPPPKVTQIHQYGIDPVADLEADFNRLPRKNIYNVVDKDMNKKQTNTIAEDFRELIAKAKATNDPVVKRGFIMLADAVVNRAYTLSDREGFKQGYNL
jgi:hypothetical protein